MDKAEIYLRLFQEYITEARHHEQQRATVSGIFAALTAGVLGLVGIDGKLTTADIPASVFLIVIGVFGCFFCAKQYERFSASMQRARQYRRALETAVPGSKILKLRDIAEKRRLSVFPGCMLLDLDYSGSSFTH